MPILKATIKDVLLVYAALLPIVNPFGVAPIFASMTEGYDTRIRRTVAMRVAINGIILLVASLFIGSYILEFFGVSMGAVQLGGGMVVAVAGWQILNRKGDMSDHHVVETNLNTTEILSQAFYPLTLPLTTGPGSIAVALTLGSNIHEETHMRLILSALAAVIGILLIGLTVFLCYRYSDELQRLLGPTGTSILIRLSAFILVCIGIQIMFNGLDEFYSVIVRAVKP